MEKQLLIKYFKGYRNGNTIRLVSISNLGLYIVKFYVNKDCGYIMNNLIVLDDFRAKGEEMLQENRCYRIIAPYSSHNSLYKIRDEVLSLLPYSGASSIKKLFLPFTFDAEPFWSIKIEQGYFNHKYSPFTVLTYVIRDHYRDVFDYCNGTVISSEKDYHHYLDMFNESFTSVLERAYSGRNKPCSTDEMIKIGSLFFLILNSSDLSQGLIIDYDRKYLNPWNGVRVNNMVSLKYLKEVSESIQGVWMSDMPWQNFFFRYADLTDSDSLWFFNIPPIEQHKGDGPEQELTRDELFFIFDSLCSINLKGGKCLMTVENKEECELEFFEKYFNFKKCRPSVYINDFLTMRTDSIDGFITISNYSLDKKSKRNSRS
jgi:hypothetical protein